MRRVGVGCVLICTVVLASNALASATADGFVTRVDPSGGFALGKVNITLATDARCFLAVTQGVRNYAYSFEPKLLRDAKRKFVPCNRLALEFGSRVYLIGTWTARMKFLASSLTMFSQPLLSPPVSSAILEEQPRLQRAAGGWAGTFWLDGFPVKVSPRTRMLAARPGTRLLPAGRLRQWSRIGHSQLPENEVDLALNPSLLSAGNAVTYHISSADHGYVSTAQLRFWQVQRGHQEQRYWKATLLPVLTAPRQSYAPAPRWFRPRKDIYIVPSQRVQNWVSALGDSLIPDYQRTLPDTSPEKVHFRFYVTERITLGDSYPLLSTVFWFDPVLALPDGTILIPDEILPRLTSKAQLAALLAFAETQVLQKQSFLYWLHFKRNAIDIVDSRAPDYITIFEDQMLRIGIRQLYLNGYDIRMTPFVWTAARGKTIQNPVLDERDLTFQQRTQAIPQYTAYAFQFIHDYYSSVDYEHLKRGRAEYATFLTELHTDDPKAFKAVKTAAPAD